MKAVIVEVKGKFVAALSEDGSFIKLKNAHYSAGQQIELQQFSVTRTKWITRISAMIACCVLVCGLGTGTYLYRTPAYYVSMDVNPSVEYILNTFDRVLSVQAVNEDGSNLLQAMNLKNLNNKTIDEAVTLTLEEITKAGYFDGSTKGGIVIATSGKKTNTAEKLANHLKKLIAASCVENKRIVSVETMVVDQGQMEKARILHVTPGKLQLVQKLLAEHPETNNISIEEWLKKPVKDILMVLEQEDDLDDAAEEAKDIAEDSKEYEEESVEDESDAAEDAAEIADKDDCDDPDDDDEPVHAAPSVKASQHPAAGKPAEPSKTPVPEKPEESERMEAAEVEESEEVKEPEETEESKEVKESEEVKELEEVEENDDSVEDT